MTNGGSGRHCFVRGHGIGHWSLVIGHSNIHRLVELHRVLPTYRNHCMKKEMLINVSQPEECRIAIVEDGILEELYIERASADNYVGNIYKGRIVNLEPS